MAGVLITEQCNLKCPYCFAQDRMTDASCITLDQYREILMYATKSGEHVIKLVGGEPTIHPQFKDIIGMSNAWAEQTNSTYILFTNGIAARMFLPFMNFDYAGLLVNYNSPRYIGETATRKIYEFFDDAEKRGLLKENKVQVGFNIFVGEVQEDLDSLYKLIKRYNLKFLRVSAATPPYEINRDDYFTQVKSNFLAFLRECENLGVENFVFDCNLLPKCYFTDEEVQYLDSIQYFYSHCCTDPVLDISANMTATCCLGAGCKERVNLYDFENLRAVRRYFQATYIFPMLKNLPEKCKECDLGKTYQCHGGCLRFLNCN